MNKEVFEKGFKEKMDKNFLELSKYYDFNLEVFCEFNTLIFEINNCLLIELNRAAITLTNHLLERLLKLALINNETGIGPIEFENWNKAFEEPNKKHGTSVLADSINKCRKIELISEEEKNFLFDTIRVLMRNGFSHADSSKILADLPDDSKMFQGSFSNPNDRLKEVNVNQKIIPTFQAIQMENFAKDNAKSYFDFVFHLIFRIEKRLIAKLK
ncbi:hypothetical protein [Cellulophaga baltica]|uniref:hypothetical protein n=1 Tax=Cellulophaga baltica TaxID=76594 RepID=UPI0003F88C70|nr:hypothetical protein [Cellulophaga baltica]